MRKNVYTVFDASGAPIRSSNDESREAWQAAGYRIRSGHFDEDYFLRDGAKDPELRPDMNCFMEDGKLKGPPKGAEVFFGREPLTPNDDGTFDIPQAENNTGKTRKRILVVSNWPYKDWSVLLDEK